MSASPRQIDFIDSLLATRKVPENYKTEIPAKIRQMTPGQVSTVIDNLLKLPKVELPTLEPGTYQDGDVIFRVQKSRETGRPYALVWTGTSWAYDGNAYRAHAANAVVVPLERAIEIGVATGHCVVCGRDLTDGLSIKAGIGPICVARYGTTREEIIASRQQEAVLV